MKSITQRNLNMNYNNNLNNYFKDLLNWINSIELNLCKEVKDINDLKDGNVFSELLKYYFKQTRQKYYYSLLNSNFGNKNLIDKMHEILQIMTQITNNKEINSRIEIFQQDINSFLENDSLIMELVLYINYLFKKITYNDKKMDDSKNNTDINNIQSPINLYKNNKYSLEKTPKVKNQLKDFYDYNKYKRIIINDFMNKNYDYTSNKDLNNNKKNNNISNIKNNIIINFNKKNINNNNRLESKYLKNNIEINSYMNKPKSLPRNSFQSLYNNDNNYNSNKKKSINTNYNNSNLNSISNNSNFDVQKLLDINKKRNIKKNLLFNNYSDKIKEFINNEEKRKNLVGNHSSKILENDKDLDNYIPIHINTSQNIIENIINKIKEIKFIKNNNLNNNQNINSIFGIYHKGKLNSLENEDELNIFKLLKLTNPFIFDNNKYKKLYPKINYKKNEFNSIKVNEIMDENHHNLNNNFINYNDYEYSYNENDINFSSKKNEKTGTFTPLKNEKNSNIEDNENINNKINSIKYLMDKFAPEQKKFLSRQNSYLFGFNKKISDDINEIKEDNIKNKERLSYSNYQRNKYIKPNENNYNPKNEEINNIYNKKNNYSVDTYNYEKNEKKKEELNKNNILAWLIDIDILKKEEANIILLPQYISDGILLCDIINTFENNKIKGIFRKISSKEYAIMNINKALDYLKTLEDFPKRHLSNNELIFEIDDQTIWELLYDLYKYYTNKMGYIKINNEKNINQNNINNNLFNINLKLSRNKNRNFTERRHNFYNINEKYDDNNTKKINSQKNYNENQNNKRFNNSYRSNSLYNSNDNYNNNIYKNILFKSNYNNDNEKDNNIKIQNDFNLKKMDIYQQNNLSDRFGEHKNFKKGYFDYVNDLKYHFDQNKVQNKIKNEKDKNKEITFQYSKNIQKPLNFNSKFYLDYNDNNLNFNNNKKMLFVESPIRPKNNYKEYYNKCYNTDNRNNNSFKVYSFEY